MSSSRKTIWDVKWSPEQLKFIFHLETTGGKPRTYSPRRKVEEPRAMLDDPWFDERVPDTTTKFHVGDLVEWDEGYIKGDMSHMRERSGRGPFLIREVYDIPNVRYEDQTGRIDPWKGALHTQLVHIKCDDGRISRFSGGWFRKVKEKAN